MGKKDPWIDAYIGRAAPFSKPILNHLRKLVHANCPEVEEAKKWSFPHFVHHGILCSMAAFKNHCSFGFWKGALIKEYVEWIVEAKRAETRQKRLAQAMDRLAKGKSRNWKYNNGHLNP